MPVSSHQNRLVVFTGDLDYNVRRNIIDMDADIPGLTWLVLVHAPSRSVRQLIKNQRFNLKKHGWRWLPYQFRDLLVRLRKTKKGSIPANSPGTEYELDNLLARTNVRVQRVRDIHAEASLALVRAFGPDLGLSLAAPILKESLFKLPCMGTVNLHKGKLPEFRGMPPAFWELWTDQSSVGCSVHWVDARLDEGALLGKTTLSRERFSTQRGLQLRLDEIGAELVCNVTRQLLTGGLQAEPQTSGKGGKTYRKPTLAQQSELSAKLAELEPQYTNAWTRVLKDVYFKLTFLAHRSFLWRVRAPRVTVLLFHRVCDDVRDNLSVGVAQFERQMRLLREHCNVLSISELLQLTQVPRTQRPLVAISFDDGYLDNYVNAAPILRRLCVPCSFYVATGIVNSEKVFPHDQRRGNVAIPKLTWAQLREMRGWGFEIGSHTVNHIDCVAETGPRVEQELLQSRADLERELDVLHPVFAYPYGGRHQMNAERLALVRKAGYAGCLSAHGGSNVGTVDPWCVFRRGIHWEFSDAAFLHECLGY